MLLSPLIQGHLLNSYDQEEEGREMGAGPAGYSYYTDEDFKYFSSDDELEEELYAVAMGYGLVTPDPEVGVVTGNQGVLVFVVVIIFIYTSSSNSLQTHNGSLATVGHEGMDISVSLQVQVPPTFQALSALNVLYICRPSSLC